MDYNIFELNGWVVECESPLEIYNEEYHSKATGIAAELVYADCFRECELMQIVVRISDDIRTYEEILDKTILKSQYKYADTDISFLDYIKPISQRIINNEIYLTENHFISEWYKNMQNLIILLGFLSPKIEVLYRKFENQI